MSVVMEQWPGWDITVRPPDLRPHAAQLLPRLHRFTSDIRVGDLATATITPPPKPQFNGAYINSCLSVCAALRTLLRSAMVHGREDTFEVILLAGCDAGLVDVVREEAMKRATIRYVRATLGSGVFDVDVSDSALGIDISGLRSLISRKTLLVFLAGHPALRCGSALNFLLPAHRAALLDIVSLLQATPLTCVVEVSSARQLQVLRGADTAQRVWPLVNLENMRLVDRGCVLVTTQALQDQIRVDHASRLSELCSYVWLAASQDQRSQGFLFALFAALIALTEPKHRSNHVRDLYLRNTSLSVSVFGKLGATLHHRAAVRLIDKHRDVSEVGPRCTLWSMHGWMLTARMPPYVEVLSAATPLAPQESSFFRFVLLVRSPQDVIRGLRTSGFDARLVAPECRDKTSAAFFQHAVEVAVAPHMSCACRDRFIKTMWTLYASDVASPRFAAHCRRVAAADVAAAAAAAAETAKSKKKAKITERVWSLSDNRYRTPAVLKWIAATDDTTGERTLFTEPFPTLVAMTLGPIGVAVASRL